MKMNHKIKLVQGLVFNDCHNCNQFCKLFLWQWLMVSPFSYSWCFINFWLGDTIKVLMTALLSGDIPAITGSALVLYFAGQRRRSWSTGGGVDSFGMFSYAGEAARVNLSMRTALLSSSSLQSRERFVFRASKALLAPLQQRKAQCHKQPGCLGWPAKEQVKCHSITNAIKLQHLANMCGESTFRANRTNWLQFITRKDPTFDILNILDMSAFVIFGTCELHKYPSIFLGERSSMKHLSTSLPRRAMVC